LVATVGYLDAGAAVRSPQWFGVLVLLATAAFEATSALPEAAEAAMRASGAASRLAALTGEDAVPAGGTAAAPAAAVRSVPFSGVPRLRATRLSYGRDRVLGTVDLDLPAGARYTVTAASGTGKTTLLLTLAGLLPPLAGRITLDGVPLAGIDPELLHRTVAYLPEDAHVFATTVRDNLAVGAPDATDGLMLTVLDAVGLDDWVEELPEGLSTVLTDGAESLSGGQRRRLLLARMLLTDAPVLLLDEPFEHLDAAGTADLEALLASDRLPGTRPVRTLVVVRHPR
ncbi:ATP-binding cassette domain-containing protein, partial [Corynebacterium variabile]|uniref:ATP-binding cassette domain-containing protein n=1 Tax=Corynebacterium variabile TaxID=1727 RepID=UPI0028A105BA